MTKRDNLTIKDAYEEAGRNYRYYLGWRERLLAGYLALLAGLSVSLPWFLESAGRFGRAFVLVPFGTAGLVTLLICVLERRNRELYRTSQNVAARCEKSLPDGTGLFSKLVDSNFWGTSGGNKAMSHSNTFEVMYWTVILLLIVGGFIVFCSTPDREWSVDPHTATGLVTPVATPWGSRTAIASTVEFRG